MRKKKKKIELYHLEKNNKNKTKQNVRIGFAILILFVQNNIYYSYTMWARNPCEFSKFNALLFIRKVHGK